MSTSATPIRKVIRNKLNLKQKILSRELGGSIYSPSNPETKKQYQQNVSKTPYILMSSTKQIQVVEETSPDKDFPTGFYMLSNQEYSDSNPNANFGTDLYNARNLDGKKENLYRPAPGIKSLTSEFLSSSDVGFTRQVTVNFTCYTLKDLEILTERFMTQGREVYVEWGWASEKGDGTRPKLVNEEGNVIYTGGNLKNTEIQKLQEEVIKQGEGDFDAVIGQIANFSWSLREDGGFDCTTELQAMGFNLFASSINQTRDGSDSDDDVSNSNESNFYYSFTDEVSDLHNAMTKKMSNPRRVTAYEGLLQSEGFSVDETAENKEVTFQNLSITGKNIIYNSDFIVSKTNTAKLESFNTRNESLTETYNLDFDYQQGSYTIQKENNAQAWDATGYFSKATETIDPNECWVKWGWFEDNLLNKYFAKIKRNLDAVDSYTFESYFRSIESVRFRGDDGGSNNQVPTDKQKRLAALKLKSIKENGLTTEEKQELRELQGEANAIETLNKEFFMDKPKSFVVDEKLITTNIKQFLLPRRFSVDFDPSTLKNLEEKIDEIVKKKKSVEKQILMGGGVVGNSNKELKLASELKKLQEEQKQISSLNNMESLTDTLKKNNKISATNADQLTETGAPQYAFLLKLQQVLNSPSIESFDEDGNKQKGILRNVFINVGYLQSIFADSSEGNLGQAMNSLLKALSTNTLNQMNLMVVANVNNPGQFEISSRQIGKDTSFEENSKSIINNTEDESGKTIYEFPVHQQNSMVLSQELSTDLDSEALQAIISQNYAEAVQQYIKKNNISIPHAVNAQKVTATNKKIVNTRQTKPRQSPFELFGDAFKNPNGSEETTSITDWIKGLKTNSSDSKSEEDRKNYNDQLSKIQKDGNKSEQDLEDASNIFRSLPIAYTTDGVLKDTYLQKLKEELKVEIVEQEQTDGTTKLVKKIKLSEFGLIGVTTTLTLTGIAGLYPSNMFTTTYLPRKFKERAFFWTTAVSQNCSSETWTTQLEARVNWRKVG